MRLGRPNQGRGGVKRIDSFESKEAAVGYLKAAMGFKTSREAEGFLFRHLPKESYYQRCILNYIKGRYPDAFVWKAAAGPYSRKGIPDVCAVIGGRFYGFEIKRPYIGVLSRIQEQTIEQIRAAGGIAGVVCFPEDVERAMESGGMDADARAIQA